MESYLCIKVCVLIWEVLIKGYPPQARAEMQNKKLSLERVDKKDII